MNDQNLDLILQKLEALDADQKELHQITSALRENQDVTNVRLEALTMDVHKLHGNIVRVEQKLDDNLADIRGDVRFLNHRIADLEMDVEKLKHR